VRRTYRTASPGTRLHVLGRFLTCPYLRVLDYLPPQARVLDLGSGHGIFAHLALAAGAREVVALEPDTRKVFLNFPRPGMRVVNGYRDAVRGRFAAITLFDVLYRVPLAEWPDLFAQLRGSLSPGGLLLLKELDPRHRAKAAWNRTQERLADLARRMKSLPPRVLQNCIRLLTGILEPALILAMGALVLLIVLAILLPIIDMNQLVRL